ncbi:MAG: 4Fe-4S binding protein [Pseudomonadota bacterium]
MTKDDVYKRLAAHLQALSLGYPDKEELFGLLSRMFSPQEAELVLYLPSRVGPFELCTAEEIARTSGRGLEEVSAILKALVRKGVLFTGLTAQGNPGFAFLQLGHGFPQAFFWKGAGEQARQMVSLVTKYLKAPDLEHVYGRTPTKPFRYIPVGASLEPGRQEVLAYDTVNRIIEQADLIAVAHCPCRVMADLLDRRKCDHPLEVCLKLDELAEYIIEQDLGREISKSEALDLVKECEARGLVHLTDNTQTDVKSICNCCSCCCWSLSILKRGRVQRDVLMAIYYLRETHVETCVGCGTCVERCPLGALTMEGEHPKVNLEVCIGCGVCVPTCPTGAAWLKSKGPGAPVAGFKALYHRILDEQQKMDT